MKIALVSDTHQHMGAIERVCEILRDMAPDVIVHLGDVMGDADVMEALLDREVRRVPGNCDYGVGVPEELLLTLGEKKILALHGHEQGVKRSLQHLARYAKKKGAQVVVYGHTHVANEETRGGVILINPGSAAKPMGMQRRSMGLLTVEEDITFQLIHL